MLYFAYSFITEHITIDNYYYLLSFYSKDQNKKAIDALKKKKNEKKTEFKTVCIKNCMRYDFDYIIKAEDF